MKIKFGEVVEGEARFFSYKKRVVEERYFFVDRIFKKVAGVEEKKVEAFFKRREEEVLGVGDS